MNIAVKLTQFVLEFLLVELKGEESMQAKNPKLETQNRQSTNWAEEPNMAQSFYQWHKSHRHNSGRIGTIVSKEAQKACSL